MHLVLFFFFVVLFSVVVSRSFCLILEIQFAKLIDTKVSLCLKPRVIKLQVTTHPLGIYTILARHAKPAAFYSVFCLLAYFVTFLSATRLSHRWVQRQMYDNFMCCQAETEPQTMTSVSASNITLAPTQSVGSRRPA